MIRTFDKADGMLLLRSLLPSAASILYSFLASTVLIGAQMLSFSSSQTLTPLQKAVLQSYNDYLLNPLDTVLRNDPLNRVLLVVLWGAFAWLVFELISRVLGAVARWRSERHEISATGMSEAQPHAREFAERLLWQAAILLLAFIVSAALHPLLRHALTIEHQSLHADAATVAVKLGTSLLIWMGAMHCYVILVRWYIRRTRVFGEILY